MVLYHVSLCLQSVLACRCVMCGDCCVVLCVACDCYIVSFLIVCFLLLPHARCCCLCVCSCVACGCCFDCRVAMCDVLSVFITCRCFSLRRGTLHCCVLLCTTRRCCLSQCVLMCCALLCGVARYDVPSSWMAVLVCIVVFYCRVLIIVALYCNCCL